MNVNVLEEPYRTAFLDALIHAGSIASAALLVSIPPHAIYTAMNNDDSFKEQVRSSLLACIDTVANKLYKHAITDPPPEDVLPRRNAVAIVRNQLKAAEIYLKHHDALGGNSTAEQAGAQIALGLVEISRALAEKQQNE